MVYIPYSFTNNDYLKSIVFYDTFTFIDKRGTIRIELVKSTSRFASSDNTPLNKDDSLSSHKKKDGVNRVGSDDSKLDDSSINHSSVSPDTKNSPSSKGEDVSENPSNHEDEKKGIDPELLAPESKEGDMGFRGNNQKNDDSEDTPKPTDINDIDVEKVISMQGNDTFEWDYGSELIKDDVEAVFNSYHKSHSKYVNVSETLTHYKDKNYAKRLVNMSGSILEDHMIWSSLWRSYSQFVFSNIRTLEPVSRDYFYSMNRAIIMGVAFKGKPLSNFIPEMENATAKTVYGMANGANELAPFMNSEGGDTLKICINHTTDVVSKDEQTPGHNTWKANTATAYVYNDAEHPTLHASQMHDEMVLDADGIDYVSTSLDVKSYNIYTENHSFDIQERNSPYSHQTYHGVYNKMYANRLVKATLDIAHIADIEKRGIIMPFVKTKGSDSEDRMSVASLIKVVVNNEDSFYIDSKYIKDSIIAWFNVRYMVETFHQEYVEELLAYFSTTMLSYVRSSVRYKESAELKNIKIEICISRKPLDSDPHTLYCNAVHKGAFVPMTPLHYSYYFNPEVLDSWRPYVLLSSLAGITVNSSLHSVLPSITKENKLAFRMYMMNKSSLSANYYLSKYNHKLYSGDDVTLSKHDFVKEMFVRTCVDDIPGYYPLISRGGWIGDSANSESVGTSSVNKTLVKYSMKHRDEKLVSIAKALCFDDPRFVRPEEMRSLLKLVENVPNLFWMFITKIEDASSDD